MAIEVIKMLTDDLTGERLGEDGGESVLFAIDGQTWEVDLSHARADELRDMLRKYQVRKVMGSTGRKRRGTYPNRAQRSDAAAIREWGEKEGLLPTGKRGRIPATVREAYERRDQVQITTPEDMAKDATETKAPAKKTQPKAEAKAS